VTTRIDPARYSAAPEFPAWLGSVSKHADLWQALYRTATVSAEAVDRMRMASSSLRLLVLSEDWCSDCFSTVPIIARLAELAGVELRVFARDANLDVMDAHLSGGTRSIPVVMVLDPAFDVRAWWGPRPSALQRWYRNEGLLLESPERSRKKRSWYARDRGRSAVAEVIETVERAARSTGRMPRRGAESVSSSF
jgi:thiol-disulfide isomerase/thioredoxin